ncbi:hypothetical protein ACFQ0M_26330 [Kitasatospora aburaviensis]
MTATQRMRIVDGTLKFFAFVFGSGAFVFSTLAGSNSGRQVEFILYGIATTGLTVLVGSVEARRARTVHGRVEALARETSRGLNELVTALAPGATFTANISGILAASGIREPSAGGSTRPSRRPPRGSTTPAAGPTTRGTRRPRPSPAAGAPSTRRPPWSGSAPVTSASAPCARSSPPAGCSAAPARSPTSGATSPALRPTTRW